MSPKATTLYSLIREAKKLNDPIKEAIMEDFTRLADAWMKSLIDELFMEEFFGNDGVASTGIIDSGML